MTQKQIKEEILKLKQSIPDYNNDERYRKMWNELHAYRKEFEEKNFKKKSDILKAISEYEKELENIKKNKAIVLPKTIQVWFDVYKRSADFGYSGLKISWISPDEKYVIVSQGGTSYASGMSRNYGCAEHWISDLESDNWINSKKYPSVEGRLTKEKKQYLIDELKRIKNE